MDISRRDLLKLPAAAMLSTAVGPGGVPLEESQATVTPSCVSRAVSASSSSGTPEGANQLAHTMQGPSTAPCGRTPANGVHSGPGSAGSRR